MLGTVLRVNAYAIVMSLGLSLLKSYLDPVGIKMDLHGFGDALAIVLVCEVARLRERLTRLEDAATIEWR